MTIKNETTDVKDLASKVQTIEDRKGNTVKAIRMSDLNGVEAETEALKTLTEKYPSVNEKRGIMILIGEKKRAVWNRCEAKGCKTESLTRTSDLFQCKTCSVHRAPKKSKGGTNSKLLDALSAEIDG